MSTYNRAGYVFGANPATEFIFSPTTKVAVDGKQRIRANSVAIKNGDSASTLQFSFDNTSYTRLTLGEAFGLNIETDRVYLKTSDSSCYYQLTAALQGGIGKL